MARYHTKSLTNEIKNLKNSCDKYIRPDNYYMISSSIEEDKLSEDDSVLRSWMKKKLKVANSNHVPVCVYCENNNIYFIFSPVEKPALPFLKGSYSKLISHYTSLLCAEFQCPVNTKVLEFTSRSHIIPFLTLTNQKTFRRELEKLVSSTQESTDNITNTEIIKILDNHNINIDTVKNYKKYGELCTLKRNKSDKVTLSILSELFDVRYINKYEEFIFSNQNKGMSNN